MDIVLQRRLDNGLEMTVNDCSRRLVGDRWLVRLEIRLRLAPEGTAPLEHTMVRERCFVADDERDRVVAGFLAAIDEQLVPYLSRPQAVERLRQEAAAAAEELPPPANPYAALDEDDGPADFSFLFAGPEDKDP